MYSSNIAEICFGITLLFALCLSNYLVCNNRDPVLRLDHMESDPPPGPRDPPDQAKHYRDNVTNKYRNSWPCSSHNILYMRWPDRLHRPNQSDLWFDRLVYIHHDGNYDYIRNQYTSIKNTTRSISDLSVTLNGIIFEHDRILTAYNPFRQIIKFAFKRHYTHVCVLKHRCLNDSLDDYWTRFRTDSYKVSCARQVVPLEETNDMPENLWHGRAHARDFVRQHSPLHDLMVIRTEGYIKYVMKDNYKFQDLIDNRQFIEQGPALTRLAKKDDVMGSAFKFAMMGHIFRDGTEREQYMDIRYQFPSHEHYKGHEESVKRMRDMYVGYYDQSDNVLTDCDEWIPREWGYFICVLNKQKLRRLASGAALYSRGLLFGIGSFTLFKGDESIIVFTDVRPYESLITDNVTGPCTTTDQFGKS